MPGGRREPQTLVPGMVVIDRRGRRIGLITQVNSDSGPRAITVLINGVSINLRRDKFERSRNGEEAVILLTPSQIRTATILNTD
jgi:hypothetical protein